MPRYGYVLILFLLWFCISAVYCLQEGKEGNVINIYTLRASLDFGQRTWKKVIGAVGRGKFRFSLFLKKAGTILFKIIVWAKRKWSFVSIKQTRYIKHSPGIRPVWGWVHYEMNAFISPHTTEAHRKYAITIFVTKKIVYWTLEL